MTTPDGAAPDVLGLVGGLPVKFWRCLQPAHRNVDWDGPVATCPDCGLTNVMVARHDRLVAEAAAARGGPGCEGCAVVGPLLTGPGTSGRDWKCGGCGHTWPGRNAASAAREEEK